MSKFYLCEVVTYKDDTADSKSIYEYGTLDEAKAHAKQEIGSWMLNDNCDSIGVTAFTESFTVICQDYWKSHEDIEPEQ